MAYHISGLALEPFIPLFALDDAELERAGALRVIADAPDAFPCRVTIADALPGERVLLLNFVHQPAATPYRASHAIYVREAAVQTAKFVDAVPAALARRLLAVRAFDSDGMMVDADIIAGADLGTLADRLLANRAASYLHVHYAKRGCYAARIDRV